MRLSLGLNVEKFKSNFAKKAGIIKAKPSERNELFPLRHGYHVVVHLRSYSFMSVVSSSSLASGRNPESSYCDSSTSDRDLTPSPPVQEDSHDEYTPTR